MILTTEKDRKEDGREKDGMKTEEKRNVIFIT
jgi:hypothetical protein